MLLLAAVTLAYQRVPPARNSSISGILNLSRNMGGDIGIALVTTLLARRFQLHQARLAERLDAGNPLLRSRLADLAAVLQHAGDSSVDTLRRATGMVGRQLSQQAQILAYLDVIFVPGCFTALMVPLVLLARPCAAPAAH